MGVHGGLRWLVPAALALGACGTGSKAFVLDKAFALDGTRRDTMEATLRILDEHPTYVDEFFAAARKHKPTLERFLAAAAADLHQPDLARLTAEKLVRNPDGLRRILIETLDAARDRPKARHAIASAIQERAATSSSILLDEPQAMAEVMRGSVDAARKDPAAWKKLRALLKELVAGD
jgi:hypothetical protein